MTLLISLKFVIDLYLTQVHDAIISRISIPGFKIMEFVIILVICRTSAFYDY